MGHLSGVEVSHVDPNATDAMPFWFIEPLWACCACAPVGRHVSPKRNPSFVVNENRFVEFGKIRQKMPLQPTGKMVLFMAL